jgi:hypothetical protein
MHGRMPMIKKLFCSIIAWIDWQYYLRTLWNAGIFAFQVEKRDILSLETKI